MECTLQDYIELPEHWRYSSAANYAEKPGLIEVDGRRKWTQERPEPHSHAERGNDEKAIQYDYEKPKSTITQ